MMRSLVVTNLAGRVTRRQHSDPDRVAWVRPDAETAALDRQKVRLPTPGVAPLGAEGAALAGPLANGESADFGAGRAEP